MTPGSACGEMIDQDMHVVAASGEQRLIVVGAPAYLASHPALRHPRDLAAHPCIIWRAGPGAVSYRWEFTDPEHGHDFAVAIEGRVATNDLALMSRLARAGVGLTMLMEEVVHARIERGELVPVLETYSTPFPGFYLYYPQRRQASPPLRALLDYLGRLRPS